MNISITTTNMIFVCRYIIYLHDKNMYEYECTIRYVFMPCIFAVLSQELFTCVYNISNHIRESELSLMAIEKILSFKVNSTSIACMTLCFYTLQLSMRNNRVCCSYWRGDSMCMLLCIYLLCI